MIKKLAIFITLLLSAASSHAADLHIGARGAAGNNLGTVGTTYGLVARLVLDDLRFHANWQIGTKASGLDADFFDVSAEKRWGESWQLLAGVAGHRQVTDRWEKTEGSIFVGAARRLDLWSEAYVRLSPASTDRIQTLTVGHEYFRGPLGIVTELEEVRYLGGRGHSISSAIYMRLW